MFTAQAVLVGNLLQYFCERNSLEEELSALRNGSNIEKTLAPKGVRYFSDLV